MSDALTRRGLLKQQAALGAGLLAANALLRGPGAAQAAEPAATALHPRFFPLPDFIPDIDLGGKLAVVTGASTGIGRATGEALALRGVRVIGTSRDVKSVSKPPKFPLWNLDVSEPASIDAFMRKLRRKLGSAGRVDILVNNAGRGIVGGPLPPDGGEARYFEQVELGLRTDYTGHVMMSRRILPLLPAKGYARVGFTASVDAYTVSTSFLAYLHGYTSAKRALLAFANAWRTTLELTQSNVKVVTVNPYQVNTRFPWELILTEKAPSGSVVERYVTSLRQAFGAGLPASMVGEAYRQLFSMSAPPPNVAVGSAAEPYATQGNNRLIEAVLLAENGQGAVEFAP